MDFKSNISKQLIFFIAANDNKFLSSAVRRKSMTRHSNISPSTSVVTSNYFEITARISGFPTIFAASQIEGGNSWCLLFLTTT